MKMTLCVNCRIAFVVTVEARTEVFPVLRENVEVETRVAVCPVCGEDISDEELYGAALHKAFQEYRIRHRGDGEAAGLRLAP